jgi:aspartyl protease family protein
MLRRMLRACLLLIACLAAAPVGATGVMVLSLAQDRADLMVNGTAVRSLRSGQSSPEGVRLVSATPQVAIVEIEGKQHALGLGQANIAAAVLTADALGHFRTTAYINGQPVPVLIDTGASFISMSSEHARALSLDYRRGQRVPIQTANGVIEAWRINLASVRVGDIIVHNIDGVVAEAPRETTGMPVLGMSFLNMVEMQRRGNTLTLSRRR